MNLVREIVSFELKDRSPVLVVHISAEEPSVLPLNDISGNDADLSVVGVTPVGNVVTLGWVVGCPNFLVKGALAQGAAVGGN